MRLFLILTLIFVAVACGAEGSPSIDDASTTPSSIAPAPEPTTTNPPEGGEPGPTTTSLTNTTSSPATTAPAPPVDAAILTDPLIVFESEWLCDVQRFAFPTPEGMGDALQQSLDDAGLTSAEYRTFKAALEQDEDRRIGVLYLFENFCPLG